MGKSREIPTADDVLLLQANKFELNALGVTVRQSQRKGRNGAKYNPRGDDMD